MKLEKWFDWSLFRVDVCSWLFLRFSLARSRSFLLPVSVSVSLFVSAPVSVCVVLCHVPIVILLASDCAVLPSPCSHFVSRIRVRVRSRDVT